MATKNNEVATTEQPALSFTDEELRGLKSWDAMVQALQEEYGVVEDVAEHMGNGFALLKDKSLLVGRPLIIVDREYYPSDYEDGDYVALYVMDSDGRKWVVTDGSSGIREQVRTLNRRGGYIVKDGLRESKFETCAAKDCGRARSLKLDVCPHCGSNTAKRGESSTYYLAV